MKKLFLSMLMSVCAMAQATVSVGGRTVTVTPLPRSTLNFSLNGTAADSSGNAVLPLNLTTTRRQAAAVQFDLAFTAGDFVTTPTVAVGPVGVGASKTVSCNSVSINVIRCIVAGLNQFTMSNGVVANVTARVNKATAIGISNVMASSLEGTALNVTVTPGGGITATLGVISASCVAPPWDAGLPVGTYNVEPTEVLQCSAALSGPAPVGGLTVATSSSLASVAVSAVVFAAGASTASFTITGI